jgi:anti-sigma B factor antagonist
MQSKSASPSAHGVALVASEPSVRTLQHHPASSSVSSNSQITPPLSVDEQRIGRRALLTAVGEVDISSAADLQRALDHARDGGAPEIWLDFTRTTFMDCGGLRALRNLRASLHDTNRRLLVICPAGPVLRLLTLTGVDRELEIHPTRTAAQSAN